MEESGRHVLSAIEPKLIAEGDLTSDESVVFESRPSCWSCMKAAALALVIAIAANIVWVWGRIPNAPDLPYASAALSEIDDVIAQSAFAIIALIALIAALWFFHLRGISRRRTVYVVTDERIIRKDGVISEGFEDIPVTMIEHVRIRPSWRNRFYGTIEFSTEGPGGGKGKRMIWEAVPKPRAVRRILQEVQDVRVKPNRDPKRRPAAD